MRLKHGITLYPELVGAKGAWIPHSLQRID